MFYSQFILAKKGPLGTIWIAAHLERKLRKNQVADTDIGVSVDSILFPEIPIALRLSSHLLLGVVRIYSRKVNYLFDDCSEALLKIKQAFRSTAVDLAPEESTAPYHSITLPETFDLDDFELPDNDIFQSSYVDHHVSTREQITLQDTMEGVVYSTSQFGLDERFGDGDASQIGLDLDEDLFLDKVAALGNDQISNCNPEASVHSDIPQQKDGNNEEITETSDDIRMNVTGDEIVGLASTAEVIEYAQGPSTPGLVEEPNLTLVQEALAFDDHLEAEYHNPTYLGAMKITENASSKSSPRQGEKVDCSLQNDLEHQAFLRMRHEDHGCLLGEADTKTKQEEHLTCRTVTMEKEEMLATDPLSTSLTFDIMAKKRSPMHSISECSDRIICALDIPNKAEDIHNGVVINNELIMALTDQTAVGCSASDGVRVTEAVTSPSCSHVTSDLEDPSHRSSNLIATQVQESRGHFEDVQTSARPEILNDLEFGNGEGESCTPVKLASNPVCLFGSPGRLEVVSVDAQAPQEPEGAETSNSFAYEATMPTPLLGLQACTSHVGQSDISLGGEKFHEADVMDPAFRKCQISESSLCKVQSDKRKLDLQVENEIPSDCQLEPSEPPAPEKMLSLPTELGSEPNDLLVESMPDKQVITGGNSDPSGMRFVSGKKRSFVESTPTVQSLNSVESFGMILSKGTSESIPDDDDLLSSILVGRRSSGLKIKPTPAAPEVASVKRPRYAHRGSATKRKVLMDDMMVLHGETIRQQLTNTEDIRRVRKKAPCSNHDILMIQRQFLDEEIIREPIFTGMSSELIFLHGETFDLNGVKVSENDPCEAFSESAKDRESHSRTNFAVEYGMVKNSEHHVVQNNVEGQPADLTVLTDSCEAEINVLSHDINTLGRPKVIFDVKELETFHHVEMDIDRENSDVPKSSSPAAHVIGEYRSDDFSAQPDISDKTNDAYGSLQKDEKSMLPGDTLETLPIMEYEIGAVASEIAEHNVEIRAQGQTDCSEPTNNLSASAATTFMEIFECNSMSSVNGDETLKENKNSKTGGAKEDETPGLSLVCDDKDLTSSCTYSKETEIDSLHSVGLDLDAKDTFLKGEENPVFQEAGPHSTVDADISAVQHPLADNNVDDVMVANDTGFLNVDDDEVIEDDDYDMPCSEGTYLENSGWSSRTRAVARYLQGLFGKDTSHGRKNVPLDHLLAGKTRKEASRMFFETLVLKTRDYVHVEQMKPFESVNIKPRVKLMKSDF